MTDFDTLIDQAAQDVLRTKSTKDLKEGLGWTSPSNVEDTEKIRRWSASILDERRKLRQSIQASAVEEIGKHEAIRDETVALVLCVDELNEWADALTEYLNEGQLRQLIPALEMRLNEQAEPSGTESPLVMLASQGKRWPEQDIDWPSYTVCHQDGRILLECTRQEAAQAFVWDRGEEAGLYIAHRDPEWAGGCRRCGSVRYRPDEATGHFHCDNCGWIWVAARPRATSGQEGSRA